MQQYIQKVNTSLERADNLIQSLLAFSKGQTIDPQPVNINTLIKKWVPFCVNFQIPIYNAPSLSLIKIL